MSTAKEWEQRIDSLIEEYLLFLRGHGPEPDLSGLPPIMRKVVGEQFEVIRACAEPALPPIEDDPVARRLGLVPKCLDCGTYFKNGTGYSDTFCSETCADSFKRELGA